MIDPGAKTPTREPYAGDEAARRIRAAVERLHDRQWQSSGTPAEVEAADNEAWREFDAEVRTGPADHVSSSTTRST